MSGIFGILNWNERNVEGGNLKNILKDMGYMDVIDFKKDNLFLGIANAFPSNSDQISTLDVTAQVLPLRA